MAPRRELMALALELVGRSSDPQWMAGMVGVLPTADAILQRAGIHDPQPIYDRMFGDAHLASQTDVRAAPVLAHEWRLEAADPSRREDVRAAELCESALKGLRFRQLVEDIHSAVFYGYSVVELMWAVRDGAWIPEAAHRRPNRRVMFSAETFEPRILTREKPFDGEPVPERKLLITQHKPTTERPQGIALLNRCFWPWTFKTGGWRFWMTFAERFGLPWVHVDMPAGTSTEALAVRAKEMARAILDAVMVTSGGDKLAFHQANSQGASELFSRIISEADADISKALVGQTLTSDSGGGTGSYALGKVHDQVRDDLVEADRALVAQSISQMLSWVTELNVAGAGTPVFRWVDEDRPQTPWAEFIKAGLEIGLQISPAWAHQKLNIPQPGKAERPLKPLRVEIQDFAAPAAAPAAVLAPLDGVQPEEGIAFCDRLVAEATPIARQSLAAVREAAVVALTAPVAPTVDALTAELLARGGAEPTELERQLRRTLMEAWIEGEAHEAEVPRDYAVTGEMLRYEDAERAFAGRIPMTREEFDALSGALRAKAFTVSAVADANAVAAIQRRILTGMEQGDPLRDIIRDLPLDAGHAETVVRNATQTSYHAGRYQSALRASRFRPYFRYVTAGDERVRPSHRALHGRVFSLSDPDIGSVYPSNGHRCRCTIQTLSPRQLEQLGSPVETVSSLGEDELGDPGFRGHPLATWKPDVAAMAPEIQAGLRQRAESRWKAEGQVLAFAAFLERAGLLDLAGVTP